MNTTLTLTRLLKSYIILLFFGLFSTWAAIAQEPAADQITLPPLVIGNGDSNVHIVEFVSYTCPHCANFHNGPYGNLKQDYIDTNKIKFEIREMIWDAPGWIVSVVGRCGNAENYFSFVDLVFAKQQEWTQLKTQGDVAQRIKSMAVSVGYDGNEIDECFQDKDYQESLVMHSRAQAQELGITSTPSFVVNGRHLKSFNGYDDLVTAIEAQLN